ncbi:uncharacterized protein LOC130430129 [Triplophysa dalaica]|uniref:uncharacterized protein LOC130430129 n=1 Tax=Triplophysa dalaica TaxID=1582913 RepID=UPI0024DFA6E0|nr:uncharacterized protein LOC130430129 [Triplophysa dalaica]
MKTALTVYLLLISVYGVCGVDPDEVKSVSAMEGESVTLHSNLTELKTDIQLTWTFKLQASLIAEIIMGNQINVIFVSNDGIFKDRLQMNNQTGSLTITNIRTKHSGLYKLQISSITETLSKRFRVTVCDSLPLIDAETGELKTVSVTEGDPAYLMMEDVEIQTYDLIVWRFGDDGILILKGDREDNKTTFSYDEIYGHRLELNYQTGSLTITDARITDTGLYKVKISGDSMAKYKRFILTVSASGISSGGVAGIVIVVLLAMSGAVGVFLVLYRRRTSEIKKQNDVLVDKTVVMKPGDSVALHTGVKEIQKDDDIIWTFKGSSIAQINGDQTIENIDERFKDKLKLNRQTGSLIIKDTKTEHTGLYKVKMTLQDLTSAQIFNVSASDKLSVNEGDSFTLNSGHTEIGDKVITWRFGDVLVATINGNPASDWIEERFRYRVQVDPQTGSLTVTNSRTEDSGLYQLQISGKEKSERKFTVTVRESTVNKQNKPEIQMIQDSPSIMTEQIGRTPSIKLLKQKEEKIQQVSVMEGDSFTLNTGDAFIQRPDMIQWMFGDKCIAELIGKQPAVSAVVDDRFTYRLKLDHQTGSLTITNITTTDSGHYILRINPGLTEDLEFKFNVIVNAPSTKNEGNVPESTHSLMIREDPSDRRNESDPLLRKDCVNVVDEEEGMSE